jgi:sugar phosphate isomerase/epimerase
VLQALADAGYTGPCSVEIEFKGEPWPPLAEVTRAMTSSYRHLSSLGLS